jgi:hypothetical protein
MSIEVIHGTCGAARRSLPMERPTERPRLKRKKTVIAVLSQQLSTIYRLLMERFGDTATDDLQRAEQAIAEQNKK